jgi:HEAT repeat protein
MLEAVMSEMSLADRLAKAAARLTDEEVRAARAQLETLQQAGILSFEQLIEAVSDASIELSLRLVGCRLLGSLRDPSAATALAKALAEAKDEGLVWGAANALAALRTENATASLLRVLEEGGPVKQAAAAWVLGWQGVPAAIPSLRAAAMDPHLTVDVRAHATEALGVLRAREAVPELITTLSNESPELRYWAAYSLGQIGDPAAIPALERVAALDVAVLPHDRSVMQEALEALEAIREREQDRAPD